MKKIFLFLFLINSNLYSASRPSDSVVIDMEPASEKKCEKLARKKEYVEIERDELGRLAVVVCDQKSCVDDYLGSFLLSCICAFVL